MKRFKTRGKQGFALVVTLSMMILLTILAVGLLSLSAVELRRSANGEARAVALANARLGLMLALGQLQREAGDDRRVTADGSILDSQANPAAVGVWNGWSPGLGTRPRPGTVNVDYKGPKGQTGFRSWLVSAKDPTQPKLLDWHKAPPLGDVADLYELEKSGFNLQAEKVSLVTGGKQGGVAWAVTQENTKAKINIGVDDKKRISLDDQMQTPARPNLSASSVLKHPQDGWGERPGTVISLSQVELDQGYAANRDLLTNLARDYTVDAHSLLTNTVSGGLKVDLTSGFDLTDGEFAANTWGTFKNPFRSTTPREYGGQKPLFQPLVNNPVVSVFMDFAPASLTHKFAVNGAPTFDTLRSYYRVYRHLYNSSGGTSAFERPYSHVAMPKVSGRPFGVKSHPNLAPILDRVSLVYSIFAKGDGTLCILMTPYVTIWNPHNVDIETEGLVIYPWIDFAVFWNWDVQSTTNGRMTWNSSLSRFVGEGFQGHGRSTRPYFYLHLTQSGNAASGSKTVSPPIHLNPGEVRVFCLADTSRRDLEILQGPAARTWRMRPVNGTSDMTGSLKGGIVLNMTKSIAGSNNFNYKLKPGDRLNSTRVEFDRSTYYYIMSMADAWQIKNPNNELMVESRPAGSGLPALDATPNLNFYAQVHSHRASAKSNDSFTYPSYTYEEIAENPKVIGSMLTYHRVAQSSSLPLADMMFTTNPRQAYINQYLSGVNPGAAQFQSAPHYESLMQGGSSLAQLAMETTTDGRKAFYGPSHSAASGKPNLIFFEIPRSPTLSLGSFQHCDLAATPYGCASQIANSWASPYLSGQSVARSATTAPNGESIAPSGLSVYDLSYLANETLFDGYFLSGAAPQFGSRMSPTPSPDVWNSDQISESTKTVEVLEKFFTDPVENPLRNPRMTPYRSGLTPYTIKGILDTPARCLLIAGYLMVDGGFNINSTSEEAWTAVLASLRGAEPASDSRTAQSRFRHILTSSPYNMKENDPWSGFRTLTDTEIKTLAKNLVLEIKKRGPFLSLGEFVNRRVTSDRSMSVNGAIQTAIDKSNLNKKFTYASFDTSAYPNRENIPSPPNTGTNTPGWLSQADILHGLAPYITPRSDTFVIRSVGEARDTKGQVVTSVMLEAVVQRVPDWVDPIDDKTTAIADLKSEINKTFGRRFSVVSVREIRPESTARS
ncbi:MAG: hypothetical protein J0M04_24875 [Verrucomicrobia bacterium]|nr:hypothetical protein [Verrucomicrobiota bacterium]